MGTGRSVSYEQWFANYEKAFAARTAVGIPCSSCGARRLRIEFIVRELGLTRGAAAFWCDSCLLGLFLAPVPVPAGLGRLEGDVLIPNYDVIPPSG